MVVAADFNNSLVDGSSCMTSYIFFSLWIVDDLGFNWEILNSFPGSFNWLIFNNSLFDFLGDVFNLSFNGIIVSNGSLDWDSVGMDNFFILYDFFFIGNSFNSLDSIVLNVFLFEWNVLDSAFDWDFLSNCSGCMAVDTSSNSIGATASNIASGGSIS